MRQFYASDGTGTFRRLLCRSTSPVWRKNFRYSRLKREGLTRGRCKSGWDTQTWRKPCATSGRRAFTPGTLNPASFFKMLTGRTSLQVYIKLVGCDVALGQRLIAKFRGLFLRKFLSINRSDMWMAILF